MAERGAVVVTGTSSGIGRACALGLDRAGFRVFAGVRKEKDGAALAAEASAQLTPIILDVTDEKLIAAAARRVGDAVADAGLAGLVNNAGVGFIGPLEFLPLAHLRRELEVNVTGQLAVVQAFLPLLRRARGRVVNIGSIGGRVALPFGGAICASKFALEALSDTLRMELLPWGIHVVLVEPGLIATPAIEKANAIAQQLLGELPPAGQELYGEALRSYAAMAVKTNLAGSPPEEVAAVVERALTARKPKTRYPVGKHSSASLTAAAVLPDRLFDKVRLKASGLPSKFGGRRSP